jgi:hypothetical protein
MGQTLFQSCRTNVCRAPLDTIGSYARRAGNYVQYMSDQIDARNLAFEKILAKCDEMEKKPKDETLTTIVCDEKKDESVLLLNEDQASLKSGLLNEDQACLNAGDVPAMGYFPRKKSETTIVCDEMENKPKAESLTTIVCDDKEKNPNNEPLVTTIVCESAFHDVLLSIIDVEIQPYRQTFVLHIKDAHLGAKVTLCYRDRAPVVFFTTCASKCLETEVVYFEIQNHWSKTATIVDNTNMSDPTNKLLICIWRVREDPETIRIVIKPHY